MAMLRIVTDGAADMPPDWAAKYDIHILPLHVNFGEESYTQGPNFTRDDFYRLVREKKMIPTTSLPSIGAIKAFYRSIAQKGDNVLSIHVSGKLSGTFSTVEMAAREIMENASQGDAPQRDASQSEMKIIVFDSLAGSAAQAYMARQARMMDQAGQALPEIVHCLERIREKTTIIFTLDTLDFAFMSGRINFLQNRLAAAFQVKPIIVLREGLLDIADKVRTRQRSIEHVLRTLQEKLGSRLVNIAVVHAADVQAGQNMLREVKERLNVKDAFLADLSIPVAAHLGPGAIGVVAYPVEE